MSERMTVRGLIANLQELVEMGYGDAKVYVHCEPFTLIDVDAGGTEETFYAVPLLGWDEAGSSGYDPNGHVIFGREDPDDVVKRMVESGRWAMPTETLEAGVVVVPVELLRRITQTNRMMDGTGREFHLIDADDVDALEDALSRLQQNGGEAK